MELKQFVKEALLSIIDGVKEANLKQNRFRIIGVKRNESGIDGNMVDFDVSIVAEQKSEGKVGGKVGTSILNVVSANVDSKLNQTDSQQNVNRLKFKVWISEDKLS
ncbi:hypothetical protein HY410_00370 [Candidatus Gottesmanbacteria bacterium]|nr:hypothetical protein [Candidatus Gottesmanbacteria bacterium]